MALIFEPQYTISFDTYTGSNIIYEIDVLRSYRDTGPVPTWVGTAPRNMIGRGNRFAYLKVQDERNPYKPIRGVESNLHLVARTQAELDDLSLIRSGSTFEYKLRIRQILAGASSVVFEGFITSIGGGENITTFPTNISFKATDGLGLLEESTVRAPESNAPVVIFNEILESIRQTGLDLPVFVDSQIEHNGTEAITQITSHPYSAYANEDRDQLITRKQHLEGFLRLCNCRIVQANGRFYIYNGSTLQDETSWQTFEVADGATEYTPGPVVTESLLKTVDGTDSQDLVPAFEDLKLIRRRGAGSIECRPQGLTPLNYTPNGDFGIGMNTSAMGFETVTGSLDPIRRVNIGAQGLGHPTAEFGVRTNRNRFILNAADDQWFQSELIDIDPTASFTASVDHYFSRILTSSVDNGRMNWQIEALVTNAAPVDVSNESSYSNELYADGNYFQNLAAQTSTGGAPAGTQRTWYWHHSESKWVTDGPYETIRKGPQGGIIKGEEVGPDGIETWRTASVNLHPPGQTTDPATLQLLPAARVQLRIRFFHPTGKADGRKSNRGDGLDRLILTVTNISIQSQYENDILSPTYERITDNGSTHTLSYRPTYIDEGTTAVYQRINEDGFSRTGNALEATTPTTFERITTQQRLNDFRGEFREYRGTFINQTTNPITFIDKIGLDWENYSETSSLIQSGGRWDLKGNAYQAYAFVPNQATDEAPGDGDGTIDAEGQLDPGFYPHNVDLLIAPFLGNSAKVAYYGAIVVSGLDDLGALIQTVDINGVAPGDTGYIVTTQALQTSVPIIREVGLPGDLVSGSVTLTAADGFQLSLSNLRYFGDGLAPLPFFSSLGLVDGDENVDGNGATAFRNITFSTNSNGSVRMDYEIVLPAVSEFEQLHIASEIDPFIGDNNRVDLTLALSGTSVSGITISNSMRPIIAPEGSTILIQVFFSPPAGMQFISPSTIAQPTIVPPTGILASGTFTTLGMFLIWEGAVTIPAVDTPVTATFDLLAANITAAATGASAATVNIDFNEAITNLSLGIADLSLIGIVGTSQQLNIPVYASSGHTVDFDNLSITTSDANLVSQLPDPTTENVPGTPSAFIPVLVSFPTGGGSVTVDINGSAQEIGATAFDYTIAITNDIPNTTLVEGNETLTLESGMDQVYSTFIRGGAGYNLRASNIRFVGSAGWVAVNVGSDTVELRKTITGGTADVADGLTLELVGEITREPYTWLVSVVNNVTSSMISTELFSFGYDDGEIGQTVATVEPVDGNRRFTIQSNATDMAFEVVGEVDLIGGTVVGILDGVITIEVSGVAGTPNAAGVYESDLVINPGLDTGTPALVPATTANIVGDNDSVRSGETFQFNVTVNGAADIVSLESLALEDPFILFTPSTVPAGTHSIIGTISVAASSNGRQFNPLFPGGVDPGGATSGIGRFAVQPINSNVNLDTGQTNWTLIGVNRLANANGDRFIGSQDLETITVDIGGTPGAIAGTLYIT